MASKGLSASFGEWLNSVANRQNNTAGNGMPVDWGKYTIDDRLVVDEVFQYDDLVPSMHKIFERLGISWNGVIGHEKQVRDKAKRRHYSNYYNSKTIEIVRKAFEKEINHFGYKFEESD